MKKAVIIGGGFAGLSAVETFARSRGGLQLVLIDKKKTSDFLPTLPDCVGRGISPQALAFDISAFCANRCCRFLEAEVTSVDLEKREVATAEERFAYDYLIIASGSETNFYGNDSFSNQAFKIDDARDAATLVAAMRRNAVDNYVICGGGYTGIEAATAARVFLKKHGRRAGVIIVERAGSMLGPLPEWMKAYTAANLRDLEIEVLLNSTLEKMEGRKAYVSGGRIFDNALTIWTAGVQTAGFIQDLKVDKNPQGRIKVDKFLRVNESCFAVGDAAYFRYNGGFLRMAVQFAIAQAQTAAMNVLRDLRGKKPEEYRPRDFGYIIPMANSRSCGAVMGVAVQGMVATALHFLMCIYRSRGLRNKWGIVRGLLRER
jgi:NADH:ubiquinone reductase (H+-translocating)